MKLFLVLQFFFGVLVSVEAAFLNIPELVNYNYANANICSKSSVLLKFNHQDFNPGNVFTVEISQSDSFLSGNTFSMVGTLSQSGSMNAVMFTVNFPANIAYGNNFRLRIKGSDPITYSNQLNQYPFSVSKFDSLDQNFSTEGYWRGSFYSWTPSISGTINNANNEDIFNPNNYLGYLTEDTLSFDYNWGTGFAPGNLADTTKVCGSYRDFFSLRMRRKINFEAGYYIFGGGADDGFRLSTDGGSTWLIEDWNDHGYRGSIQNGGCGVLLTAGIRNVVVEFYENRAVARFRLIIKKTGDPSIDPIAITNLLNGAVICSSSSPVQLIGNPIGGNQWSGPDVQSNGILNPQIGGMGPRNIVYQTGFSAYGQNCMKFVSVVVDVVPGPSAQFSNLLTTYCTNSEVVNLIPQTSGGIFSGPGVSDTIFSPALAGPGIHVIKHFISTGLCADTVEKTVIIVAPSIPMITNLPVSVCKDLAQIVLTAVPSGGFFSGAGIIGDTLLLNDLLVGNDTIYYTVSNGPCVYIDTAIISVGAPISAQFSGIQPNICRSANAVTLIPQNPGGIFSGSGVSGTNFSPDLAGSGIHIIKYVVSNGICADSVEDTINVTEPSSPLINNLPLSICKNQIQFILTALPAGGIFSGAGITGNTYSPNNLAAGNDTVFYRFTNGPCVNFDTAIVNVVIPVSAQFSGIQSTICFNANPVTLIPQNPGGQFFGQGVVGNVFDPLTAGSGIQTIEHILITQSVCLDTARFQVEVLAVLAPNLIIPDSICISASPALLNSNVLGTFSGPGIDGNSFNPALANVGSNLISFVSIQGLCSINSTAVIKVLSLPDPSFNDLPDSIYNNSPDLDLIAVTLGGIFEGQGVTLQNKFSSSLLIPENSYIVRYKITKNTCFASSQQSVYVRQAIATSLFIARPNFCLNPKKKSKISFSPTGGFFSGSGVVVGDSLSAAGLQPGDYTLTYKVVLGTTSDSSKAIFTVLPPPDAGFDALPDSICVGSANVVLKPNVSGGRFEGQGVTQDRTQFSPEGLIVDNNYFVDYKITNANGCTNQSRDFIYIKSREKPVLTFPQTKIRFCTYDPVFKLVSIPLSQFYLNSSPVSEIDPAKLPPGQYALRAIYSPLAPNKRCEDSASAIFRFTIIDHPKPDLGPDFELEKGLPLNLRPNILAPYSWKVDPSFGEFVDASTPLTFVPKSDVELTITAYDPTNTCYGYDAVKVTLREAPEFPNLITPNGDGDNDVWEIKNGYSDMEVIIFNRWGQEVHNGKTKGTLAWDGKEAKEDGLYFYIITKPDDGRKWNGWIMVSK